MITGEKQINMEYDYDGLVERDLVDQCDEIRAIANKKWLSSAHVSLNHLDQIKAKVYNFGLSDVKDLKATNIREKRPLTDPPLSTFSQQNAWGSNHSIPELIKQHSEAQHKRPVSAKSAAAKTRPPSGRKPRPQSAKEQKPPLLPGEKRTFGILGAKYDPADRPANGVIFHSATMGWVGPPAGLKYPEKQIEGSKLGYHAASNTTPSAHNGVFMPETEENFPPPPQASPISMEGSDSESEKELVQERPKKVFEVYLSNIGYENENTADFYEDDADDVDPSLSPVLLRKPTPDAIHFLLPKISDWNESDTEPDTERLLREAETMARTLDEKEQARQKNTDINSPKSNDKTEKLNEIQETWRKNAYTQESSEKILPKTDSTIKMNASHPYLVELESHMSLLQNQEKTAVSENQNFAEAKKVPKSTEKVAVKFSEDKNMTFSITPRNIGRKVAELSTKSSKSARSWSSPNIEYLVDAFSASKLTISSPGASTRPPSGRQVRSSTSRQKLETVSNDKTDSFFSDISSDQLFQEKSVFESQSSFKSTSTVLGGASNEAEKFPNKSVSRSLFTPTCTRNHLKNTRPKSPNRPTTPITTVSVDYGSESDEREEKPRKKKVSKDVVTMMQQISLSDDEGEGDLLPCNNGSSSENINKEDDFTLLHTVCKSKREKNYYEIARLANHTVKDKDKAVQEDFGHLIKTTKTIEFDELKPKEVVVKSVIDGLLSGGKEKEKFMADSDGRQERNRYRLQSAKVTQRPPGVPHLNLHQPPRPASQQSSVTMTANKTNQPQEDNKKANTKKVLTRPSSAPAYGRKSGPYTGKENKNVEKSKKEVVKSNKESMKSEKEAVTEMSQAEREKVIDNLLERTQTLLENKTDEVTSESTEKPTQVKKERPKSAISSVKRNTGTRRIKSAGTRRPDGCAHNDKHYSAYARATNKSKSSGKRKIIWTEPCYINTKSSLNDEDDTEEYEECLELQRRLAERGVDIAAETLERALYPPSGKSKYYEITASLPRSSSLTLLNHPRHWLPEEHKKLIAAEKALARANEIMHLQKRAEARKAKLEEMGVDKKKKKTKGKKKLKRSNSFG